MRKLTPIFLTESCFEAWQKRARQAREKLLKDMKTAGSPNEVLNKAIWQDFKKEILMRYFPHGKCVFCEGRYSPVHRMTVSISARKAQLPTSERSWSIRAISGSRTNGKTSCSRVATAIATTPGMRSLAKPIRGS